MLINEMWHHFMGRRRRLLSTEGSESSALAIETAGPVDISWLTEEALMHIVETEPHTLRSEAALHVIESRVRERIVAAARVPFMAR